LKITNAIASEPASLKFRAKNRFKGIQAKFSYNKPVTLTNHFMSRWLYENGYINGNNVYNLKYTEKGKTLAE
jgi:hypothetical protein